MIYSKRYINASIVLICTSFLFSSCTEKATTSESDTDNNLLSSSSEDVNNIVVTDEAHSKDTDPNYAIVFPQDEVARLDIVISDSAWQVMQADLESKYGVSTSGPGGDMPGGGMPGGDLPGDETSSSDDPVFVPATVNKDDEVWNHVGIRYKGNSSLSAGMSLSNKLPFKLDFDEFESLYPEINDQRFYGFKKITFSSGYKDNSLMREKLAPEIFRDAGIPAPQTAFYRIFIDYGDGPIYFGLYTAVEVVDDTMIKTQFSGSTGNCYKPENDAATFATGSYDESDYALKTNEDIADYSDIESLYDIINSSTRTSDVEAWKDSLEAVFNVPHFLKWLAVNTLIENWDTYGVMSHNYYLYVPESTGKLTWIPWDNNEALSSNNRSLSYDMSSVNSSWPLISNIIAIPEYEELYNTQLKDFIDIGLDLTSLTSKISSYQQMIEPYVTGDEGELSDYTYINSAADFTSAVSSISTHLSTKISSANSYLN